jgi:hypothetical protein
MLSTKTYATWSPDPDDPAQIIVVSQRDIAGAPVNYTFRAPIDPLKTWDKERPVKIQYLYRKILRVWQSN